MALILFVALSLLARGALGDFVCEQLPADVCSFSIASSGQRCLLEYYMTGDGRMEYQCKTSQVVVAVMREWIETDDCIGACGVDRNSIGISSDTLLQPYFPRTLCSSECYDYCPNIVDLYFNLALGEGAHLPSICEEHIRNPRRAMMTLRSSVEEASGPVSGIAAAPLAEAPWSAEPY